MIPRYKKKYVPSDRFKKKIYTPCECLIPTIEDGYVFVCPKKRASIRKLEKLGFVEESSKPPKKAKSPLFSKTVKELRKMASELDISGRSTMSEAQLVEAITKAGQK
jgi:hypothetical protein